MGLMDALGSIIQIGATAAATAANPAGAFLNGGGKVLAGEVDKYGSKGEANKPPATTPAPASKEKTNSKTPSAEGASIRRTAILAKLTTKFVRRAKPATNGTSVHPAAAGDAGEAPKADTTKPDSPETTASAKPAAPEKKEYGSYDLSGKFIATDKALAIAPAIKVAIDQIKAIIVGSPEGIQWSSVQLAPDAAPGSSSDLMQSSYTLDRLLKEFQPTKDGLASQLAVAIMTEAIGVADDLEAEAVRSGGVGQERPGRKTEFFKDLDARITRCASTAESLNSVIKSSPGTTGSGGGTLNIPQPTSEEKIANMNYKASIADQTVKSATTKLLSTQETYKATLDTYMKQSEQLLQVQDSLLAARQQVASLASEKMTLESVKKTLSQCMGYLAELKDRISKLVVFFSGLKNLITACIDSHVLPFKTEIETYAQENKDKSLLYEQYYRDVSAFFPTPGRLESTLLMAPVSYS